MPSIRDTIYYAPLDRELLYTPDISLSSALIYNYNPFKEEALMFASRKNEEDGTFNLCIRRGRAIQFLEVDGKQKVFNFPNYAIAKQCSDELNARYLDEYTQFVTRDNLPTRRGQQVPPSLKAAMLGVIQKYATFKDVDGTPVSQTST